MSRPPDILIIPLLWVHEQENYRLMTVMLNPVIILHLLPHNCIFLGDECNKTRMCVGSLKTSPDSLNNTPRPLYVLI